MGWFIVTTDAREICAIGRIASIGVTTTEIMNMAMTTERHEGQFQFSPVLSMVVDAFAKFWDNRECRHKKSDAHAVIVARQAVIT